ncbi:DNA-3-methyladenine glycosylase [Actinotalea sp. BY-33]|uniref:Putative 3-methyladenine DNA glycosylase n=1 Tax=Actinotalea soli TaxID=2819234 RepID=A0A939RT22_9CELL|nr:DNA-3-methyladenine glycosylase [Actinotalea soli]MBO1753217.1 DNA-3-methyladenine glycosylase [Actinotalea soli]
MDPSWLERPVPRLAPALLGGTVTVRSGEGTVTVRLTEVEAYDGAEDPGSHAFRGRTARNASMFGAAGHLYVYRHLGLHHCVNLVTGRPGEAAAVLLRAGEVVAGRALARERRRRTGVCRTDVDLARGPARLAVALGLDLEDDGAAVLDPAGRVSLLRAQDPPSSVQGPRVGVSGPGGDARLYPWRFWVDAEPSVSAYRPGAPRRPRTAH